MGQLAGLILKIPNFPIQQPSAVSDYNNGATLIRAGPCVHVISTDICNLARPVETPLCKM